MTQILAMLQKLLKLMGDTLQPAYFVYDGTFGNNAAVQMSQQVDLHLISKLPTNSANLSLWMVNVSQAMLERSGEESILDLKARHHGLRYARELFKILPKNTKQINITQLFDKIPVLERIHIEKMTA